MYIAVGNIGFYYYLSYNSITHTFTNTFILSAVRTLTIASSFTDKSTLTTTIFISTPNTFTYLFILLILPQHHSYNTTKSVTIQYNTAVTIIITTTFFSANITTLLLYTITTAAGSITTLINRCTFTSNDYYY